MSKPEVAHAVGPSQNDKIHDFNQNQVHALVQKVRLLEDQLTAEREERNVAITTFTSSLEQSQLSIDSLRTEVSKQLEINALLQEKIILAGRRRRREEKAHVSFRLRAQESVYESRMRCMEEQIAAIRESRDQEEQIWSAQVQQDAGIIQRQTDQLEVQRSQLAHYAGLDSYQRELELIRDYGNEFQANNFGRPTPNYIKQMITDGVTNAFVSEHTVRPLTISKVVLETRRYRLDHSALIKIGMKASDRFFRLYGQRPRKNVRAVGGNVQIDVNIYFEGDRDILLSAIQEFEQENPNYAGFF